MDPGLNIAVHLCNRLTQEPPLISQDVMKATMKTGSARVFTSIEEMRTVDEKKKKKLMNLLKRRNERRKEKKGKQGMSVLS